MTKVQIFVKDLSEMISYFWIAHNMGNYHLKIIQWHINYVEKEFNEGAVIKR